MEAENLIKWKFSKIIKIIILRKVNINNFLWFTKYVVGVTANPPKKPNKPPKNGNVIAMNIVNAENKNIYH